MRPFYSDGLPGVHQFVVATVGSFKFRFVVSTCYSENSSTAEQLDSNAIVARFEAERQALAMMDHVNIARVLDGGATDSGRPYFVMELVKGVSITE